MDVKRQVMLIILDGWGYREDPKDNAIAASQKPFFDSLWASRPHSLLAASGEAVGLPEGQMGNSEVGHTTIGAGTAILTDLVRITKAAKAGDFLQNEAMAALYAHAKEHDSALHVIGLVSTGGVHSHQDHVFAFMRAAKEAGAEKIVMHAITDGRDTPPQSGVESLQALQAVAEETGAVIASVSGRYYAMDRDKNWDRTEKTVNAIFQGQGEEGGDSPVEALKASYANGKTDEHVIPLVFKKDGQATVVQENDAVFFVNFRPDRARQLSRKIIDQMDGLKLKFATMTGYEDDFGVPVAFPPVAITTTLGQEIAKAGYTQSHIAETEKFAHATYFLNGGRETPYEHESDILLDSRKDVPTHDKAPEMRAQAIADAAIKELEKGIDFIFINFANPDMVGHTAVVPAIITAIETVDAQLKRVIDVLESRNGIALITADHGNAEINVDQVTGEPHTSHTTSPVPFILFGENAQPKDGTLANLAPTILKIMGIEKPEVMNEPLY